jgi:hypothetical protein
MQDDVLIKQISYKILLKYNIPWLYYEPERELSSARSDSSTVTNIKLGQNYLKPAKTLAYYFN